MQTKKPKRWKGKLTKAYKYAVLIPETDRLKYHPQNHPAYRELRDFIYEYYIKFDVANKPIMLTTLCLKIKSKCLTMPEYKDRVRPWNEIIAIINSTLSPKQT